MSDTKLTYELDGSGRIMVKATNQGVLLSKEEAERVVAHIDELERSYAILQNHFDKTRQRWIIRGEHIAKQRERIAELESLVKDMLSTIRLGSMSDLTDKRVLASWLNDFSKRASELGLLDGDAE